MIINWNKTLEKNVSLMLGHRRRRYSIINLTLGLNASCFFGTLKTGVTVTWHGAALGSALARRWVGVRRVVLRVVAVG